MLAPRSGRSRYSFRKNRISHSQGPGIDLADGATHNRVEKNRITANGDGITTFEARHFDKHLNQIALPEGWRLSLNDGSGGAIARRGPPRQAGSDDVDASGRNR